MRFLSAACCGCAGLGKRFPRKARPAKSGFPCRQGQQLRGWPLHEPLGGRERACACGGGRHLVGARPAPLLAQAQEHISGLSVELDDEHLLLTGLLSLSWFCMCPAMNFKLVGRGPSSQSASDFFVGRPVSVRKGYLAVISVG